MRLFLLVLTSAALLACAGEADLGSPARQVQIVDAGRSGDQGGLPVTDAEPLAPMDMAVKIDQGAVVPLDQGVVPDRGVEPAPDMAVAPDPDMAVEPEPDMAVEPEPDMAIEPPCPVGTDCNPIVVDVFPSEHAGDTRLAPPSRIDRYNCPDDGADESGPEVYFVVDLPARGVLSVQVDDVPGDDVDIDVYLLGGPDGDACITRGNRGLSWALDEGRWWIVADSWVNGGGEVLAGRFNLTFAFLPVIESECRTERVDLRTYWQGCAPGVDCYEEGGRYFLRTPATGPVVKEAHLVTVEEEFDNTWPVSARDGLDWHYAISTLATGFAGDRTEPWAPAGEGGSRWGQGSTSVPLPVLDEAWYVNMYWRDRPPRGTRMLVRNPRNGRAVVAAAGWETGPGSNTAIGGVVEEVHTYLNSGHRDDLELGFLLDQNLPLGPVECF